MSNKVFHTIRLIVLLVLLVLLIMLYVFLSRGKNSLRDIWEKQEKIVFSGNYADVAAVEAKVTSCTLRVEEWDGKDTQVTLYSRGMGTMPNPAVSMEGSTLQVKLSEVFSIKLFGSWVLEIKVPAGSAFDYDLSSSSGSIKLDAKSRHCVIKNTSGSVKVMKKGESLKISASSGSVKVHEAFENCTIDCTSGSIKAMADEKSESLAIKCSSGSVKVQLASPDMAYQCNLSTVSGSIRDEYLDSHFSHHANYPHGEGGVNIDVSCTSGSIKLCDWD